MMHWDVYAIRSPGSQIPHWRARLCDGSRHYGEEFTCYQLDGVRGIVRHHDRLYPVDLRCLWSYAIQRSARAALERAGLQTWDCIPF
jgi:hypothetical protein